jgi:hypothetical protein
MVSPTASCRQEGTCGRAMGRGFVYRMRNGTSSARLPVGSAISEKRAPAGFAVEARENSPSDGRPSRTRARVNPLKQPHVPYPMGPMTAHRRCPHARPKDAQPLDICPGIRVASKTARLSVLATDAPASARLPGRRPGHCWGDARSRPLCTDGRISRPSIPTRPCRVCQSVRPLISATDPAPARRANTPGSGPVETSSPHRSYGSARSHTPRHEPPAPDGA